MNPDFLLLTYFQQQYCQMWKEDFHNQNFFYQTKKINMIKVNL